MQARWSGECLGQHKIHWRRVFF